MISSCKCYTVIGNGTDYHIFPLYSFTAPTNSTLPCGDDLSCPRVGNITQCFNRSELCNMVEFCSDGSDEGLVNPEIPSNLECMFH